MVNDAIRQTGYDAESLVSAKLQKIANLYPDLTDNKFHLLDFGCGVGNLYGSVAQFFPKAVYTGVDTSKDSIKKACSRFQDKVAFQEYDFQEWKSCKYDLIFSAGVFHHIPHTDHTKIINKLYSLLNPGGKLVIWEHNPINPVTLKIVKDCPFDRDAVLIPSKTLKEHFNGAALSNVQIIYTTFFPKFLSFLNFLDPYLGWLPLGCPVVQGGLRTPIWIVKM